MLSYMVPSVEEKPPPVPTKVNHLQLDLDPPTANNNTPNTIPADHLTNGHPKRIIKTTSKSSTISGESSASSLSSVLGGEVAGTHATQQSQDKNKHKIITNGPAKHPTLKRWENPNFWNSFAKLIFLYIVNVCYISPDSR